ncbi:MAG: hypothetical protein J6U10_02500 [Lachnospiraceae bacterium]|nr:hypothetical protein [Lachnospiraceae bacterium]
MRIDAYTNYNTGLNLNVGNLPEREANVSKAPEQEAVSSVKLERLPVEAIYERSSERPKTDYGGYTTTGRKQSDVQTEKLKNYVVGNVASILKTNENNVNKRMDRLGLSSEDMVDPAKAMTLSKNLEQKYRLFEYSMQQRNILKDEMRMNDSELDTFIGELKNAEVKE